MSVCRRWVAKIISAVSEMQTIKISIRAWSKHEKCLGIKCFSFQFIHAQFIVEAAPHGIRCSKDIRLEIQHHLNPPFEELFDPAEEYILEVLFEAWSQMIMVDLSTFDKVINHLLYFLPGLTSWTNCIKKLTFIIPHGLIHLIFL